MTDDRTPDVLVVLGPRGETDAADRAFLLAAAGWAVGSAPGALSLDRHCPTCGGADHGRPIVRRAGGAAGTAAGTGAGTGRRLDVSLSRAGSRVAVALSFAGPVGIDIESVDAVARAGFDDVAFNLVELAALAALAALAEVPTAAPADVPAEVPAEGADRARAAIWTGKEAALKAIGVGLRVDPRALTVSLPGSGGVAQPELSAEPGAGLPRLLPRLACFDAGSGLAGAVAVFTTAGPVVRVLPAASIRGRPPP